MERLEVIKRHMHEKNHHHHHHHHLEELLFVSHSVCNASSQSNSGANHSSKNADEHDETAKSFFKVLDMIPNEINNPDLRLLLPGPCDSGDDVKVVTLDQMRMQRSGKNILALSRDAVKFGHDGIASNIVFPFVFSPKNETPFLGWMVVISNPSDAARIASNHVLKSKAYGITFLGDGVLSTRNNELWKEQRQHLTDAFLPQSSLKKIFPVSLSRAQHAIRERLPEISRNGTISVEINEFFLHEAMAQLQLALMGESEEKMNETNIPLRKHFNDAFLFQSSNIADNMKQIKVAKRFILDYATDLVNRANESNSLHGVETTSDNVKGPLCARIADLCPHMAGRERIQRDTAATFYFAGHDTTANLMTWFTFEMARNPNYQKRLQSEIDALFEKLKIENNRSLGYEDLTQLKFMTRCIAETLRMWPSVPNGTLREFQFDDEIIGRNGKKVIIPKGTQCMIPIWQIHLNKALWGEDVEIFNPDRDFLPEEIFFDKGLMTYNPTSYRYAPFTFQPRGCIGQPFANMEARVILAHFFYEYSVSLAEPTLSQSPKARDFETFIARNNGTMSPVNGIHVTISKRSHNHPVM